MCSFISKLEFPTFNIYTFVYPVRISLIRDLPYTDRRDRFLLPFCFSQTLAYLCGAYFTPEFCWYGIPLVFPFCLSKDTGTTQGISGNFLATFSIPPCISCLKTWQLDYLSAITIGSFCSPPVLCSLVVHSMALYFRISYSFPIFQPTYFIMHLVFLTIPTIQMNHSEIKFIYVTDTLLLTSLPVSVLYESYLQGFNNDLNGNDTLSLNIYHLTFFFCALLLL